MSNNPFPTRHGAKHGHRYREEAENLGGATHFDAPQPRNQVSHGEWGSRQAWEAPATTNWNDNAAGEWTAAAESGEWNGGWGADADRQPQPNWQAAQSDWNAQPRWENAAAWDNQAAWNNSADEQSGWDESNSTPTEHWSAPAAPNATEWAGASGSNWDAAADPSPSGDYRPVYSFRTASGERLEFSGDGARVDHQDAEDDSPARPSRSGGRRRSGGGTHRLPAPPAALKGRAAVVAVAAGAVVAAGQAGMESVATPTADNVDYQAAAQVREISANETIGLTENTPGSPQVLSVSPPADLNQFNDILRKGAQYASDLAAAEAAKLRPLFTKFAAGNYTSGYGIRWGVQHLGVDVAAPIGTPIYAVADATVLEAGPASGFGMWVRLLHDDGTVTIYGHIDTAVVSQGQRVLAGDQIATVGNRGFSTGPHCHFEVWLNGVDKIDPLPWLASRGISLGTQRD